MTEKTIVVAGDAAVDWFMYPVDPLDSGGNWRLQPAMHQAAMAGGAVLLGEFVEAALTAAGVSAQVVHPTLVAPITAIAPSEVIHSTAILNQCKLRPDTKETVLRVRQPLGFMGPDGGTAPLQRLSPDPEQVDVVVLDDVGNGFRDQADAWPRALKTGRASIVIYKMSRPLAVGNLWEQVSGRGLEKLIVVLSADDLRRKEEVFVSRALSWERTAKDVAYQIQRSNELRSLQACPYLIVLFQTDGAILYRGGENARATLFFDPAALEGGCAAGLDGTVFGLTSVFTATLAAEVATHDIAGIENAVGLGLARARALLASGYVRAGANLSYQTQKVFASNLSGAQYASCLVEPPSDLNDPDPVQWRILDQRTRNTRELIARNIVFEGLSHALKGVPVGTFGALKTIDRIEIESYSAIRELIGEFLHNPKPACPLCFAVFGPPGAGKSFGVKQVLKSLGREDLDVIPAFNVSQFREYRDLVAAFHTVRDKALGGKVPVAFFDEFDADCDGHALGWLKYFLAPMQDAEFRDGEATHPIGKAIFVFAGGTRSSFERFQRNRPDEDTGEGPNAAAEQSTRLQAFRDAKGRDFVSRLRGFVNVMGPNRQGEHDDAFVIRRAMILRVMIEQSPKTVRCFDSQRRLRIDTGVLRAMLHTATFKHGTRSIEALLDMSRLAGRERYDLSSLPPADQLDQHVDAKEFMFLTVRERLQSVLPPREWPDTTGDAVPPEHAYRAAEDWFAKRAAKLIHEDYRRHRELEGQVVGPYEAQSEDFQRSNQDAAEDIPSKLLAVRHGIRKIPQGKSARTPDLTDDEIREMARREHDRWCAERRIQGWAYGPKKVPGRKLSPFMVPLDRLPKHIQEYDIEAARAIPGILMQLGYEIYRMQEVEEIDETLIDRLARTIHADYVAQRKKEGHTPETNPASVEYDQLSAHLKESNRDSAITIPRKLRAVGYGIRRPPLGQEPTLLELIKGEIEIIAEIEHVRWNWQHWLNGWAYKVGPKDEVNKTHPYLLPWDQLPPNIQEYDRQSARLIPQLLKDAGYDAYRLPDRT